ncbi:hypothetical protein ACWDOP_02580 [Nocardia sp. NPDC003693]
MPDPEQPEAELLREWLRSPPIPPVEPPRDDPAAMVRAVLERLVSGHSGELEDAVVYASVVQLMAARTELDRLELELMRAAGDHGRSWTWIAEAFGHRSKQAAHARASALHRRLEHRNPDEEEDR